MTDDVCDAIGKNAERAWTPVYHADRKSGRGRRSQSSPAR